MRIIVSDTSCMIDLRKVWLLEPLLRLFYEDTLVFLPKDEILQRLKRLGKV